ncbi:MAG: ABC transporter permease [Thermoanaerobaculum sp.]|nr:ABC transporter permease [Thermoanaerobaculum sp.]
MAEPQEFLAMGQLRVLFWKEVLQLRRDPKILPILLLAPIVQLIILGYAATTDIKRVELGVCDLDRTTFSRSLVQRFTASQYFSLVTEVPDQRALEPLLAQGKIRIGLTIPRGFAAQRINGEPTTVQSLVDGSDATSATVGLAYAQRLLALQDLAWQEAVGVQLRPKVLYNPDLVSRNFMVPGVLAMIIMVTTMMLAAMALVREREQGSWEQLLVTPLSPRQLLLGKLLPYAAVGFGEILLALPLVLFYFRVPVRGSLALLLLLCVPFVLATLGLGLLVSTLSQTQQQAMMLAAFVFMVPQIYLSGFIFPIENMPKAFQLLTYAIPLRYFVTMLRGVFLKGVGLEVLWPHVSALLLLDVLILAAARVRFRRTLA